MSPSASPKRQLVLIGLMGAGKTSVGKRCAQRLGREFVDTDDVVTRLAGMRVPELFATAGEARFRELERDAVADVCASPAPLVIACGGGAVLDPANRRALSGVGFVVWLQAPVAVLATRVGDGNDRPLLRGDPREALTRLAAMREPAYEAAADVRIDTTDRTVDDVAADVVEAFGAVPR